jgi:hypothetical protein
VNAQTEADLVIALTEDLRAKAGSQLIIIDGVIVRVIPPHRSLKRSRAQEIKQPRPGPEYSIQDWNSVDPPMRVGGAMHNIAVAQQRTSPQPDAESQPSDGWGFPPLPAKTG